MEAYMEQITQKLEQKDKNGWKKEISKILDQFNKFNI